MMRMLDELEYCDDVIVTDTVPCTSTGKVQRHILKAQALV